MAYVVLCRSCRYRTRVPEDLLAFGVRCPKCQRFMDVGDAVPDGGLLSTWVRSHALTDEDARELGRLCLQLLFICFAVNTGVLPALLPYLLYRHVRQAREEGGGKPSARGVGPRRSRYGLFGGMGEWLGLGTLLGLVSGVLL